MIADAGNGARIPLGLQEVFLKSLGGDDVENIKAPKNGLGSKMFQRDGGKKFASGPVRRKASNISLHSEATQTEAACESAADASVREMKKIVPMMEKVRV